MAELAAPLVPKATRHTADADAAPGEYVERLHGRRCLCAPSCLSAALAVAGIPIACAPLCGACVVVHPREAAVVRAHRRGLPSPAGTLLETTTTLSDAHDVAIGLITVECVPRRCSSSGSTTARWRRPGCTA